MKRSELIPILLAGLAAILGGGWLAVRRLREQHFFLRGNADGSWLVYFLLLLAGISLVVFLTYAFTFAYSASFAVI